jgi:hypothetical protein
MEIKRLSAAEAARSESIGSSGQLFFGNEDLSYELAELFREKRPEKSAMKVITFDGETPWGARRVKYRMIGRTGKAAWLEEKTHTLPTAAVGAVRDTTDWQKFGVAIIWDEEENEAIEMARRDGIRIPDIYAESEAAGREAILDMANEVAWFGSAERGFKGLLGQPISAVQSEYDLSLESDVDGISLARYLLRQIHSITVETKKTIQPNFVQYPVETLAMLESTQLNDVASTTVMEYIRRVTPGITHDSSPELENVVQDGNDLGGCILIGRRDPQIARLFMSNVRHYAIESLGGGMSFRQNMVAKISDTVIPQPKGFRLIRGTSGDA